VVGEQAIQREDFGRIPAIMAARRCRSERRYIDVRIRGFVVNGPNLALRGLAFFVNLIESFHEFGDLVRCSV
jgi:hypothetical protein